MVVSNVAVSALSLSAMVMPVTAQVSFAILLLTMDNVTEKMRQYENALGTAKEVKGALLAAGKRLTNISSW